MGKKSLAFGASLGEMLKHNNINLDDLKNRSSERSEKVNEQVIVEIDIQFIDPNPFQPRKHFREEELNELADTIKQHGLIQPIAVRKVGDRYQIISGERRTRAAKIAHLSKIKAQVYEGLTDQAMNEWALIENIQRVDLNPIEIAISYQQLIENHQYTHEDLAKAVGKSRSAVTNALRLLKLPTQVQTWIQEGKLSSGAARALCSDKINDPEAMALRIIEEGLNVRQIEALSKEPVEVVDETVENNEQPTEPIGPEKKEKPALSADMKQFEGKLETFFGTKVQVNPKSPDESKGTIVINYYSMEDLTRIQELLENR